MLLLLGAARHAAEGDSLVRSGSWSNWSPSFMVGQQVTGKRVGIVGMGKVGQVMARRCRGFDMEVHYFNRHRLDPQHEANGIYHDNLESLLGVADFLSLHCPATDETKGLINEITLKLLPDGAVLKAIETGKLAAAGLDCFVTEPGGNPGFSQHKNIFMLPHFGSATRDAMGFRALDNLDAYFSKAEPGDRVA